MTRFVIPEGVRRLALAAIVATVLTCGPKTPPAPPLPPPVPLHLAPACDLAPAAGLEWIIDAKPRTIAAIPDLIPVIARVIAEERFRAYSLGHGGIDPRQVQDLCIAKYRDTALTIARTPFDPAKVATAFDERSTKPLERTTLVPNPIVTRLSGAVNADAERVTLFGREVVALEQGKAGPLRAAEAFAQQKLKRASPALKSTALARATEILGDAPVRVLAPGPFEGQAAHGLGGLLRATTAVAASAKFAGPPAKIAVRIVLMGAWEKDAPVAAERFGAALHVVTDSAVGRLFGVDHPLEGPAVRGTAEALILDATVDGTALARGLHEALDADIAEIMKR